MVFGASTTELVVFNEINERDFLAIIIRLLLNEESHAMLRRLLWGLFYLLNVRF